MEYEYFELEDRVYRAPKGNVGAMEKWNLMLDRWEPYRGDVAWVLLNATHFGSKNPLR